MPQLDELSDSRALISWNDVCAALDEIVAKSQRSIDVFDATLALQAWGSKARCELLSRAMIERKVRVRMLVVNAEFARRELPRLINLLATLGHQLTVMQAAEGVEPTANFVVADQQHLLFRPNSVQSRGAVIFNNPYKSMTYSRSFEVVWQQGGERLFPEAFGL